MDAFFVPYEYSGPEYVHLAADYEHFASVWANSLDCHDDFLFVPTRPVFPAREIWHELPERAE